MNDMEDKIISKVFFIENSRTRRRRLSLYDIAQYISALRNKYGSLNSVSKELAGISVNMLNRFLSVLNVDEKIIPYIKNRQIDNINAIYYIQKLSPIEQLFIANLLVEKKINSADIRALIPLRKRFPQRKIIDLLTKVFSSKNRRRYIIKFDINSDTNLRIINKKLSRIINMQDYDIKVNKNNIGTIILSKHAQNTLKEYIKNKNISYKNYFKSILSSN